MVIRGYKLKNSITCKYCGNKIWDYRCLFSRKKNKPTRNDICPECEKWSEIIKKKPNGLEVIDGVAYQFNRSSVRALGTTLGDNGRIKCIAKKDGSGRVSNDVWLIGKVPEAFRQRLPDTAWWIEEHNGRRLSLTKMKCENKACYDRYHCFRYNYKCEFEKGPYNSIPKDWITGDEKCKYFVNILAITNFFDYFDTNDPELYEDKTKQSI